MEHAYINSYTGPAREMLEEIMTSDGEIFRHIPHLHCSNTDALGFPASPRPPARPSGRLCWQYRVAAKQKRRTHINYIGTPLVEGTGPYGITLVIPLTMDRWSTVQQILAHWAGPMSLVLYASDREVYELPGILALSKEFMTRKNIVLHIVYKRPVSERLFPINNR